MFIHRIIRTHAARGLGRTVPNTAGRPFSAFNFTKDMIHRYKQIMAGTVTLSDLSVKELKEYLDFSKVSHSDCFDKESLQKRVAGALLRQYKVHGSIKEELMGLDDDSSIPHMKEYAKRCHVDIDDPATLAHAHLIAHTPWKTFGIAKEMIDSDKNLLLMIPKWGDDRVKAIFKKESKGQKDPKIAEQQREILEKGLNGGDASKKIAADALKASTKAIGTAAALLYYHGNGDDFHDVDVHDAINIVKEYDTVMTFHPVPKKWEPSINDTSGRKPESILKAVAMMRELAGECEAIDE